MPDSRKDQKREDTDLAKHVGSLIVRKRRSEIQSKIRSISENLEKMTTPPTRSKSKDGKDSPE